MNLLSTQFENHKMFFAWKCVNSWRHYHANTKYIYTKYINSMYDKLSLEKWWELCHEIICKSPASSGWNDDEGSLSIIDCITLWVVKLKDTCSFFTKDISYDFNTVVFHVLVRLLKHGPLCESNAFCIQLSRPAHDTLHTWPQNGTEAHGTGLAAGKKFKISTARGCFFGKSETIHTRTANLYCNHFSV